MLCIIYLHYATFISMSASALCNPHRFLWQVATHTDSCSYLSIRHPAFQETALLGWSLYIQSLLTPRSVCSCKSAFGGTMFPKVDVPTYGFWKLPRSWRISKKCDRSFQQWFFKGSWYHCNPSLSSLSVGKFDTRPPLSCSYRKT